MEPVSFYDLKFYNRVVAMVVVIESPPLVLEVEGSNPSRVIPKTLKMLMMAALLGAQGCGASIMTDWLVSG